MSGRVPPSSRAGKKPVSTMARDALNIDIRRAGRLFERFTGHDANECYRVNGLPAQPKVVSVIGELDAVLYTTMRDGRVEKYIHKFAATDKPLLCVSPTGRQIILVGGKYRFTERGIVDNSDKSR